MQGMILNMKSILRDLRRMLLEKINRTLINLEDYTIYFTSLKMKSRLLRFEKKDLYLKGLKLITMDQSFAKKHYAKLSTKPFFNRLVENVIHRSDSVESARKEIALWFPECPVN
ncbi:hypothetical protein REPUB_Repub04eG0245500 [Reevesia pubescens]